MRLFTAVTASFIFFLVSTSHAKENVKCSIDSEVAFDLQSDKQSTDKLDPIDVDNFDFNFTKREGRCGLGSSLLTTYRTGRISVRSNGKEFSFIPVFISDKRKYNCYAVKARTACYSDPKPRASGGFSIELKASNTSTSTASEITVDKDGTVSYPSINSQFFLLSDGAASKSLRSSFERRLADEFKCSGKSDCNYQKTYFLEWLMLNKLRATRPPRPIGGQELASDRKYFFDNVGNSVSGIRKVVQTFIMQNEIGETSPYSLGDAVLADSGPSFGSHQIDIATNSTSDVAAFREILVQTYQSKPEFVDLLKRVTLRSYEKPIREYSTGTLSDFYLDWPLIDGALRSEVGKKRYNQVYLGYLYLVEKEFEKLRTENSFVAAYPWVGFYLIDIKNQYGSNDGTKARFRSAYASSQGPADFVEKVRDVMLSYAYSRSSSQAACDTRRRLKNVIFAVNSHFGGSTPVPQDCNG